MTESITPKEIFSRKRVDLKLKKPENLKAREQTRKWFSVACFSKSNTISIYLHS